MQKESLTTITEENESELSSPTTHQTETYDDDKQDERFSSSDDEEISKNTLSMKSKTFSIDSDAASYMCFKEIVMSSSSMFNNPFYFFPNLEDPGIEDAMTYVSTPISDDDCQMYRDMCKELEIFPIGRVCRSLATEQLNLKYYVPAEKQMKAICRILANNQCIRELNLQDNWLSVESCSYLSQLLGENRTIKILKMKECRIGPEGMATLSETMGACFVEELDLSFNSLGDEGIEKGKIALGENQKLRRLNLSHNELTDESAPYLREILMGAGALEELDLGWNCFNSPKGMKILCNGFKNAESLRWLCLSWNGISSEQTVLPLTRYLRRNRILEFLDLSNNLLKGNPLTLLMKGITESNSLKHVKIGNNSFPPNQAFNCATFLARPRKRPLELLDMENMVVQRRFLELLQRIREQGKDVIHGTVLANYEIHGPYIPKVLFERCKYLGMKPKKKKRRADFGQLVLALPKGSITSAEFQSILVAKKLKSLLDYDLITAVQNQYMNKKTQKINCSQLVNDYMILYPDTELAPRKKRKKRKSKKGAKGKKNKKTRRKETKVAKPKSKITKLPPVMNMPDTSVDPAIAVQVNEPQPLENLDNDQIMAPAIERKFSLKGTSTIISTKSNRSLMRDVSFALENKKRISYADTQTNVIVGDEVEISKETDQQNPLAASGIFIFDDGGGDKQ